MAIPMPGHPVPSQEEQSVLVDCMSLHDLIDSHDAVFLLTDTRESRWLPSLLCANTNKVFRLDSLKAFTLVLLGSVMMDMWISLQIDIYVILYLIIIICLLADYYNSSSGV